MSSASRAAGASVTALRWGRRLRPSCYSYPTNIHATVEQVTQHQISVVQLIALRIALPHLGTATAAAQGNPNRHAPTAIFSMRLSPGRRPRSPSCLDGELSYRLLHHVAQSHCIPDQRYFSRAFDHAYASNSRPRDDRPIRVQSATTAQRPPAPTELRCRLSMARAMEVTTELMAW